MSTLSVASHGLWIGAIGQAILLDRWHSPLGGKLLFAALLVPWLTVFVISFCQVPPFGPRPFRYCLLSAMCWYALFGVIAECSYDFQRSAQWSPLSAAVARGLIIAGTASFFVFVPAYTQLRNLELEPKADLSQK
jgi:hypothetical protein